MGSQVGRDNAFNACKAVPLRTNMLLQLQSSPSFASWDALIPRHCPFHRPVGG